MSLRGFASLLLFLALLPAAAAAGQDVEIKLDRFGAGSVYQSGPWCGIRVSVTSHLSEPVGAQILWEVENADGDIGNHLRQLALTPNVPGTRWLFAQLPPMS